MGEPRIAVFGERGSGKTSLLARLLFDLHKSFEHKEREYRLEVKDATRYLLLLETYNKLTNNNTDSPGTQRYHDYCAELVCKDEVAKDNTSKTKVMDLEFLDYPGGWLYHTPGTEDEKK